MRLWSQKMEIAEVRWFRDKSPKRETLRNRQQRFQDFEKDKNRGWQNGEFNMADDGSLLFVYSRYWEFLRLNNTIVSLNVNLIMANSRWLPWIQWLALVFFYPEVFIVVDYECLITKKSFIQSGGNSIHRWISPKIIPSFSKLLVSNMCVTRTDLERRRNFELLIKKFSLISKFNMAVAVNGTMGFIISYLTQLNQRLVIPRLRIPYCLIWQHNQSVKEKSLLQS